MDDTAYQRYFTQPTHSYQRQYEAVRAVVIDRQPQKEVADQFGFQYSTLRQLVYEFRQQINVGDLTESPFFEM